MDLEIYYIDYSNIKKKKQYYMDYSILKKKPILYGLFKKKKQ